MYCDNFPKKENYINLVYKFFNFDCFELLYDNNNNIIAFSGLYNNKQFSKNIVRGATRTYYHPNYRVKSLNRVRWGEKYFLPYELKRYLSPMESFFILKK